MSKNPWKDDRDSEERFEEIKENLKSQDINVYQLFGGKKRDFKEIGKLGGGKMFLSIFLVLVLIWLSSGFFIVNPGEQGIVLRFGKYDRTANEGLNYHLPVPIENVTKLSVTKVFHEEIGFRSSNPSNIGGFIKRYNVSKIDRISLESAMLTGDENIIQMQLGVQWKIIDPKAFLFNVRDKGMENTIKSAAQSAMRSVIAGSTFFDALAEDRFIIESRAKELLQRILDHYHRGVKVVAFKTLSVSPPEPVLGAYDDVQAAKADKESIINKAYAYQNDLLPKARGEAEKMLRDAEAYKNKVEFEAKGAANRFLSVYNEYLSAQDVTKKRMYLETVEKILSRSKKIVMGSEVGAVPFLDIGKGLKGNIGR